ncbi:LPS assembly protein LptD, partial [Streptomyces niveiscabiei]
GTFGTDSYANLLVGQSYQLGGRNSYASGDLANTGLNSGLDTRRSDYVAKAQFQPFKGLLLQAGGRFDESTFEAQRVDASAAFNYKFLS